MIVESDNNKKRRSHDCGVCLTVSKLAKPTPQFNFSCNQDHLPAQHCGQCTDDPLKLPQRNHQLQLRPTYRNLRKKISTPDPLFEKHNCRR